MSLINKMLQDLDARGGNGARASAASDVRPVGYAARGRPVPTAALAAAGVAAAALLAAVGYGGWKYLQGRAPAAGSPVAASSPAAVGGPVAAGAPATGGNPAAARATAVAAGERTTAGGRADVSPPRQVSGMSQAELKAAGERMSRKMAERNAAARAEEQAADASAQRKAAPGKPARSLAAAPTDAGAKMKTAGGKARGASLASAKGAVAGAGAGAGAGSGAGAATVGEAADSHLNSQQKAENEYRRALAKLQDGLVSEALAGLEQAVYLYPRHEAARQTLVSLLIEGGRQAEAVRHLMLATSLDPKQASMAMLLARLQLEQGGNALETLNRSLPHAESNADYRALLAGVLQRANRQHEAAEHYQAAVRLQPANGVWWMGLGISLQAEKRNAEARAAFQRARDSGRLTPELQGFVERRLQQLPN